MSLCTKCGEQEAHPRHSWCPGCRLALARDWNKQNRERLLATSKQRRVQLRRDALQAYGGEDPQCSCCGEAHEEFLALDHVNNDGSKCRRLGPGAGTDTYLWLKKQGYPEGFQVLCHNCNWAKHLYGNCPYHGGPT